MHDFLSYLFYLLERSLSLLVPAVALAAVVLGTVWLIYRKNGRPFPWKKAILLLILLAWLVLTLFVTLLRGEDNGFREWNFHLFLAWKEAWNQFTLKVWLNVLLNIALFLPLGFLLPLLAKKFQNGWLMLITGFGGSLIIELAQLALGRGMFDVDDLFTNTLGAMLGWALIMLLLTLIKRKSHWQKRFLAYLALPVSFLLVLALIFGGYAFKPYGNLPENAVAKADLSNIQWQLAFEPSDTADTAQVYNVGRLDKAASEAYAANFALKLGTDFPDAYYYDDLIIFANHFGGGFLDLNQQDGTWEYSFGSEMTPSFNYPAAQIEPAEIIALLRSWDINVPEEAAVAIEANDGVFTRMTFTADLIAQDEELIYGTLTCSFKEENGVTTLNKIANSLVSLKPYQEEPIITQAQAVEKLRGGESFYGDLLEYYAVKKAEIISADLAWLTDTKGYYQPVYRFELKLDDGNITIDYVAALK